MTGAPLSNVTVSTFDLSGVVVAATTTDVTGHYVTTPRVRELRGEGQRRLIVVSDEVYLR